MNCRLHLDHVSAAYDGVSVLEDVSLYLPDGAFTAIMGANGSGKSTLLKLLGGAIAPTGGKVSLDGKPVSGLRPRHLARDIAMLPQFPLAPEGIRVAELVMRGRFPHQTVFRQWSAADKAAVDAAMAQAGVADLADRLVSTLSGGQRQRVWIALVLAQDTPILLLDEPTSFLDIAYQIEVMALLSELSERGRTIIAVLHDINQASRHASHLVMLGGGQVAAAGRPDEVVSVTTVRAVFGLESVIVPDPVTLTPMVVPSEFRRNR
ncbi:ABC transporter ATP-binding protein [Aquamicrobium segne]|uniref:ABC transporter ATP-binding protein n=1 Tax=Aquamicrobium segne TaxID=469547 RepID=A0ABW0GSY4_9HYPH